MCSFASATALSERPFTMTRAPSRASPVAMANPIPLVEPETRAVLSVSWRFISIRSFRSHDLGSCYERTAPCGDAHHVRIPQDHANPWRLRRTVAASDSQVLLVVQPRRGELRAELR